MVAHGHEIALDRAPDDREPDEGREDFGKERDDVDREHCIRVFRKDDRFAFALKALRRRDYAGAEAALSASLEAQSLGAAERAFLLNKRGVARIGMQRREQACEDFDSRARSAAWLRSGANQPRQSAASTRATCEGAIARYERAIASDSEYAVAHLNLGVAYKRAGRIADAVRALRQAERLERRAKR